MKISLRMAWRCSGKNKSGPQIFQGNTFVKSISGIFSGYSLSRILMRRRGFCATGASSPGGYKAYRAGRRLIPSSSREMMKLSHVCLYGLAPGPFKLLRCFSWLIGQMKTHLIVIKEYYEAKIRVILTDNNLGSFSPSNLHA